MPDTVQGSAAAVAPVIPAAAPAPAIAPDAVIPQDGANPVGADATQPETPEYQFELETGERFRTPDELAAAKAEATRTIQELNREKKLLMELLHNGGRSNGQNGSQAHQPVDPTAVRVAELERELTMQYRGEAPEAIRAEAERIAKIEMRAVEQATQRVERLVAEREDAAVLQAHPYLEESWALDIADEYRPRSAAAHLKLVQALAPNRIPRNGTSATPASPQHVVSARYNQQQEQLRQPMAGGNGNGGANVSDPDAEPPAFKAYKQAFPRATPEQLAKALNNIRESMRPKVQ